MSSLCHFPMSCLAISSHLLHLTSSRNSRIFLFSIPNLASVPNRVFITSLNLYFNRVISSHSSDLTHTGNLQIFLCNSNLTSILYHIFSLYFLTFSLDCAISSASSDLICIGNLQLFLYICNLACVPYHVLPYIMSQCFVFFTHPRLFIVPCHLCFLACFIPVNSLHILPAGRLKISKPMNYCNVFLCLYCDTVKAKLFH